MRRADDRFGEQRRDEDGRHGLEREELDEFRRELELAERIAEQASLPSGDPLVRAAARHRLAGGPSPYKRGRT